MSSVLVTGASRGIGRAIVRRLAENGWDVHAGVRTDADATDLASLHTRIRPVRLDVTSQRDVDALAGELDRLDAVVNNAGYAQGGPIEAVPLENLRRQLEVNVVGQVAVTQAVLPLLRASRGRIVFVSSVSGRIATPLTGVYNASKFAIEAVADAARLELHPWGIRVAVVEPAQTRTDVWEQAEQTLDAEFGALTPQHRDLYAGHVEGFRKKIIPMSLRMAKPADTVAAAVERALTARRPRARYVVGAGPRAQVRLAALTPTPVMDAVLRTASGVPRKR